MRFDFPSFPLPQPRTLLPQALIVREVMGVSKRVAELALSFAHGNPDLAIDWLLHPSSAAHVSQMGATEAAEAEASKAMGQAGETGGAEDGEEEDDEKRGQ